MIGSCFQQAHRAQHHGDKEYSRNPIVADQKEIAQRQDKQTPSDYELNSCAVDLDFRKMDFASLTSLFTRPWKE